MADDTQDQNQPSLADTIASWGSIAPPNQPVPFAQAPQQQQSINPGQGEVLPPTFGLPQGPQSIQQAPFFGQPDINVQRGTSQLYQNMPLGAKLGMALFGHGESGNRRQDVAGIMGNIIQAMGAGFANEGHGPGSFYRGLGAAIQEPQQQQAFQSQMAQQAAQTAQTQRQTQMMGRTVNIMTPNGMMQVPLEAAKTMLPAVVRADASRYNTDVRSQTAKDVATINQGQGIKLDPAIANAIGMPEMAGQQIGKSTWSNVKSMLTAQGFHPQDLGAQGTWLVDRQGNPVKRIGDSPRMDQAQAGAQARAYWQAKYGLANVQDENGDSYYVSKLDAPGYAPAAHAFDIFKGKQGLDNYKTALNTINSNLDVLDDPTQRALVAQTVKMIGNSHDKGAIGSTLSSFVQQGLDPRAADLVSATLGAREFIAANRAFAGNMQGSEALYNRMAANVPGPGNSKEVNQALIKRDLDNTDRIEAGMTRFQGGKGGNKGGKTVPKNQGQQNNPHTDIGFVPLGG